jgi:hypothetical protein
MGIYIEKIIDLPKQHGYTPARSAVFFSLSNQFNSIPCEEPFNVITTSFPELLPTHTTILQNLE